MVQLAIDPFYEATAMDISVKLNIDKPGGSILVIYKNKGGQTLARSHATWRTERDLTGLELVLREICREWAWGAGSALPALLKRWMDDYCPKVPAFGGRPA